jgi:thiol-disulfide isomerase/thioredoxin
LPACSVKPQSTNTYLLPFYILCGSYIYFCLCVVWGMKNYILLILCFVCTSVFSQTNLLNKTFPNLTFETLLQSPQKSAAPKDFDGKIVVLEFWATWCSPCLANVPHLNQVQGHFTNAPVVFISVTDEHKEKVEKFLAKRDMKGWIACDVNRHLFTAYGVGGIPRTVIIDKTGMVVYDGRPEQVDTALITAIQNGTYTAPQEIRPQTANLLGSWSGGDDPVFTANFSIAYHRPMPWQHTIRKTVAPNSGGNGWRELGDGGVGITYINADIRTLLADLHELPGKIRVVNHSAISDSVGWDVIFSRDKGYTIQKAHEEIVASLKQALEITLHDTVLNTQVLMAETTTNPQLIAENTINWDNPETKTYQPLTGLLERLEERLGIVITYSADAVEMYIDVFGVMKELYNMPGNEFKKWLETKGITFAQTTAPIKMLWIN